MVYFMSHRENTDKISHKNTKYPNYPFTQEFWQ